MLQSVALSLRDAGAWVAVRAVVDMSGSPLGSGPARVESIGISRSLETRRTTRDEIDTECETAGSGVRFRLLLALVRDAVSRRVASSTADRQHLAHQPTFFWMSTLLPMTAPRMP